MPVHGIAAAGLARLPDQVGVRAGCPAARPVGLPSPDWCPRRTTRLWRRGEQEVGQWPPLGLCAAVIVSGYKAASVFCRHDRAFARRETRGRGGPERRRLPVCMQRAEMEPLRSEGNVPPNRPVEGRSDEPGRQRKAPDSMVARMSMSFVTLPTRNAAPRVRPRRAWQGRLHPGGHGVTVPDQCQKQVLELAELLDLVAVGPAWCDALTYRPLICVDDRGDVDVAEPQHLHRSIRQIVNGSACLEAFVSL